MHDGSAVEARAFSFVERIQPLATPDAVIAAFQAEAAWFGFSTFALGEVPRPGSGDLPSFFISTWPDSWTELYLGENLARHDPNVDYARNGVVLATWSQLYERYRRNGGIVRALGMAADSGWPEGLCIPIHGPRGYRGIVSVGGETQDLPPRHRTALHLMSLYLHQRLMELMAPELAAPAENLPRLSPGEIECIKWLIAGKSDWEMSEILSIAEATAHWRIERAKQKFGVKTRAQLTALAVHHGFVAP